MQRGKNCTQRRAKSSITQRRIIRFRSNFVQSLHAWHPKWCKSSRSGDQRSWSQYDITYQHHKNALIQARISCRRSNLVKIIPEPSTTRNAMFKVIRSNTEIAITPPLIARLRSYLVQSFTGDALQMFKVKGQKSRSQRKLMYQQQKHYNTAMDRFSGFKLGMAP